MADTRLAVENEIANAKIANSVFGNSNRKSRRVIERALHDNDQEHTQYLYSTETLKEATQGLSSGKRRPPRGKAGETYHENAKIRVDQQDGTSAAESLEILDQRRVPKWLKDHDVRKKICSYTGRDSLGVTYSSSRNDTDREWIDFHGELNEQDMIRIWNEAINDLLHGIRAPNSYQSYAYQQELVDAIVSRFNVGARDQLLAAIMRSGKCRMTYEVARALKLGKVLVITGKTGVNEGWGELLPQGTNPHIDYVGWHYHNYNSLKKSRFLPMADAGATDVIFVSLQYLVKHIDASKQGNAMPALAHDILNEHWDMLVFDEQHWGTQTQDTIELLSMLHYDRKLELSGTAYKTLIQGRYAPEDIHSFDYVDEQRRRFNGTPEEQAALEFRPDINFALIDIDPKIKNLSNNEGFSMSKLLAVPKAKGQRTFKNAQKVQDFLNFVKTRVYGNQYTGDMAKFAPFVGHINRHTLWILPNAVASADALKTMLEAHPYFRGFKIIPAYANHVKDITDVINIINDVDAGKYAEQNKGTITLTLGRFLEGTTVPKWWCVHQMNDDKSAADYFQGSFRTKSENKRDNKRHVLVYDYSPARFIEVVYTANLDNNRRRPGQTTSDLIREWCEVSDIYDYDGNSFTLMSGDTLSQRAKQDIQVHINSFYSVGIDTNKITAELVSMMANKKRQTQWEATTLINDQDLADTQDQKTVAGTKKPGEKNQITDDKRDTADKLKQALSRLSNVIFNTVDRDPIGTFDDVCDYPDSDFIERQTGLSTAEWRLWRDSSAIAQPDQINRRIDAVSEAVNQQ
jgi:hypothetical protein